MPVPIIVRTERGTVTTEVTPHEQSVFIENNDSTPITVTVAMPLASGETQAFTRILAGVVTTGSGAINQSGVVIASGSTLEYRLSSTYSAQTDKLGNTLNPAAVTKLLTVTVTHRNGVDITDEVNLHVLGTALLGTKWREARLPYRPAGDNADQLALFEAFFSFRDAQESAFVHDWLENGKRSLYDLIEAYEKFATLSTLFTPASSGATLANPSGLV